MTDSSPVSGDHPKDARDDQTGRFIQQPNGRIRPLSPHLQVWRFHLTMLGSILNRGAAIALSVGALFVAAWIAAAEALRVATPFASGSQVGKSFFQSAGSSRAVRRSSSALRSGFASAHAWNMSLH